jgi:hypothetical protein
MNSRRVTIVIVGALLALPSGLVLFALLPPPDAWNEAERREACEYLKDSPPPHDNGYSVDLSTIGFPVRHGRFVDLMADAPVLASFDSKVPCMSASVGLGQVCRYCCDARGIEEGWFCQD